ncbi:hypothetical protein FSW04_10625 [Baekduia soli]|uniref:DUF5666 domain-containing protein n=1 Tax=Baekduia soli TaxID=496014 RepID=A0A5B8U4E7_9ACTN|nr:hypothetical protein [Baekduia soli]QEC47976.1 hypothetical protein FSW04_10625 [Baekduia soli]
MAATVAPTTPALADGHHHGRGGGDAPALQTVAGTVSAVSPGALQVQIPAAGRPGPERLASLSGVTIDVSVTPRTRLWVTDVDGDGSVTLADVAVGDQVIISTADAFADPVVAAVVLDRTHQPPTPSDHHDDGDATPGTPATAATPGTDPAGPSRAGARALRRLLHRTLRAHVHATGYASGDLTVTLTSLDGLHGRPAATGAALAGRAARVLVDDRTAVVAGGVVLTAAARDAALASAGDLTVVGRLTAPSTWPTDATGAPVPTLRARRIVLGTAAVTPADPVPADPAAGSDPPPVITN